MTTAISIEEFQQENAELKEQNRALSKTIKILEEQIAWLKRQLFGQRSERTLSHNNEQLEFEGMADLQEKKEETQDVPAHKRKKPNRNGQNKIKLPEDLPVEVVEIDLPEKEKVCKETGQPLVKIGDEVSYKLACRPASYYLKKIVRFKYVHPSKEEAGVMTALAPDAILPKCRADESLLADIAVKKFGDHLPLYRITEGLARDKIEISRRLLSQWVVNFGEALAPLHVAMKQKILESGYIYIDESPVKLQESPEAKHGFMWVVVGGEGPNPSYRIYEFKKNRQHGHVPEILGNYQGVLHSDKYGAYETLAKQGKITWVPCFAHIRRKFYEAESGDPKFREWVLDQIRELFVLEEVAWTKSAEERLHIRQEREGPIIDALTERIKERMVAGPILPKSKFSTALGYYTSLVPYLKNYLIHPFARLDNNVAERAIRPLAIGRKNWLFFGSEASGQSGAVLLSLIQTCRGLEIDPRAYLEDVSRRLMSHSALRIDELLPDAWQKTRQS